MWSKWKSRETAFILMVASCTFLASCDAVDDIKTLTITDCPEDKPRLCRDGSMCIPKRYICNHEPDCPDNSDENNCDIELCDDKEKFFKCRDGSCISKTLTCDGIADCEHADDESDAMCDGDTVKEVAPRKPCDPDKEFECEGKICISKKLLCDGIMHCFDGADEDKKMCESMPKNCHGFPCHDNRQCLPSLSFVCDGREDCNDGSDEYNCDCKIENGKFLCGDECYPIAKVCDDKVDCKDGSDEGPMCLQKDACKALNCTGGCQVLPSGPKCLCQSGFSYNNASKVCEDINECDQFGICSQGCTNWRGSHQCTCAKKFRLRKDQRTCIAMGDNAKLVYTSRKKINSINLDGGFKDTISKTRQAIGIAFDGQSYYWTEYAEGKESIVKYQPSTKIKEVLLTTGIETPEDVAVDWFTGNIYFTDQSKSSIAVCTNNGYHCTQLVNSSIIEKPRALVVHPPDALMFWSDWGANGHIGTAYMDGSNPAKIVKDVAWPNGLALDWPSRRIYWADAKSQKIETATINGKDRRMIIQEFVGHPYGLAVFEDRLYWSDWETSSISSCNKFTGKDFNVLVQGDQYFGVHVFHDAIMPRQVHACWGNPCSHICLLSFNSNYTCGCPDNMVLKPDLHTCQVSEKSFNMILGIGKSIVAIPHQTFGRHVPSFADDVADNIDHMTFNSLNGQVFITQRNARTISMVDMEKKSMRDLVVDFTTSISTLAFDYLANNLYWVDIGKRTIEVYSLNTEKRTILLHYAGTDKPTSMVLVPSKGEMFVAFQSTDHFHVDRLSMKGGHDHHHVIEDGLSERGPVTFAIDEDSEMLYWADGHRNIIEFSDFNGNNRQKFTFTQAVGQMALIKDELFWTSMNSTSLQWRNKTGGGGFKIVPIELPQNEKIKPNFINIAAGVPLKVKTHLCMKDNGGCSDICVSDGPQSRNCLCRTGYFFQNNKNTSCVARSQCGFRCSTSGECLELSHRCDDKLDCLDGSDEKNCEDKSKLKCDVSQFMCKDGRQCIPVSQRCDSHYNCDDMSDEDECTTTLKDNRCRDNQMQCQSGFCLDVTQRCDGHDDCGDGWDEREELCEKVDCPKDFFKCTSGQCVPSSAVCNSIIDCADSSDEHADCEKKTCKPPMKPCRNGWCLDLKFFCDGHIDCEDGFDEIDCNVKTNTTTCDDGDFLCISNGKCIDSKLVCNQNPECPKGEDEKDCPNCALNMFECSSGKCIPKAFVCDGEKDCHDGSDELKCGNESSVRSKTCEPSDFTCSNGACLKYEKVCDGSPDCSDDEGGMCSSACENKPCDQKCQKTPNGAKCSCNKGFKLRSAADKTCVDINECETMNPCSQDCRNTNGSFICSCHDGFMLASDKTTCNANGESHMILFSFYDQIRRIEIAARSVDIMVTSKVAAIRDFDVNLKEQKLWFSSVHKRELIEVDMKSGKENAISGFPMAEQIRHDWISGNHYIYHYTEDFNSEIHICRVETKDCAKIIQLQYPEDVPAMQVDPINKCFFFVNLIENDFLPSRSSIVKTRLDGSDLKIIANDTRITTMAIDIDQKRVYFTEWDTQSLNVIDYKGENRKVLVSMSPTLKHPLSMSLFESHAYILLQASSSMTRCKLYGDFECTQVDIMVNNARRILITQQSKQKIIESQCSKSPCEDICISADAGIKCLCANGTFVSQDASCGGKKGDENDKITNGQQHKSRFWLWTFFIFLCMAAISAAIIFVYRRRSFRGTFNVSMYFKNSELGKVFPPDVKPTPLPRTFISPDNVAASTAPTVKRINDNCHEIINNENFYESASTLNKIPADVRFYSDDETEEMENVDISDDPHQRLIL